MNSTPSPPRPLPSIAIISMAVLILALIVVMLVTSSNNPGESATAASAPPPTEQSTTRAAATPVFVEVDEGLPGCPDSERAAVVDKTPQRWWLCRQGRSITTKLPMTGASAEYGLPPVGTHEVFARDRIAYGFHGEELEHFVAFYATPKGNRIAFHQFVNQSVDTIGDLDQRGASSGCLRLLPDDSQLVWDYLQIGDPVVVVSN